MRTLVVDGEDLPYTFDRFQPADKARWGSRVRTGLRLAICKAMVDAHGGTIEVVSQRGAGSTFTVRQPLR